MRAHAAHGRGNRRDESKVTRSREPSARILARVVQQSSNLIFPFVARRRKQTPRQHCRRIFFHHQLAYDARRIARFRNISHAFASYREPETKRYNSEFICVRGSVLASPLPCSLLCTRQTAVYPHSVRRLRTYRRLNLFSLAVAFVSRGTANRGCTRSVFISVRNIVHWNNK